MENCGITRGTYKKLFETLRDVMFEVHGEKWREHDGPLMGFIMAYVSDDKDAVDAVNARIKK